MGLSHSPSIITQNLVLCLDAANPKSYPGSGTTWTDLSGNGNNGTLVNGVGYNSGNLGSLSFDGVDDYVSIPNFSYRFNTAFTISIWINLISLSPPDTFFSNWSGLPINDGVFLEASTSNQLRFVYRNNGTNIFDFNPGVVLSTNTKYNIVATYDASLAKCYINSIQTSQTASASSLFTTNNTTLQINRLHSSDTRNTNSNTYSVQVYNKALTASEIQQNFNALKSRYI